MADNIDKALPNEVRKEITIEGLCSFNTFLSLNNDEEILFLFKQTWFIFLSIL